jgi:NAD(P)-dependent dehydrogenase (short-subunit alcohol dehydrogenase family)
MNRFDGKNVLITGASAGIGQATAVRFIAEGATVFGLARNREGIKQTETLVPAPRFAFHLVDLADDEAIIEGVRAAAERLDGRIDVVCNIAGVTLKTPIDALDIDLARDIMQVNFTGPMRLISEALPHMPERRQLDHQHLLDLRQPGGADPGGVRGVQGRARLALLHARHRARAPTDPGRGDLAVRGADEDDVGDLATRTTRSPRRCAPAACDVISATRPRSGPRSA